jgi:hypothetical protein
VLLRLRAAAPDPTAFDPTAGLSDAKKLSLGTRLPTRFWLYAAFSAATMLGFSTWAVLAYHLSTQGVLPTGLVPVLYAAAMGAAAQLPEVLAPDTAIGPTSPNNSNANRCSGIRTTTVPRVSPSSQASDGAWVNTSDRPPGQNASTSSRTTLGTPSIKPSTAAHEPTKTGTGMSGPRRLASRNRRSAWLLNASQPTP